MKAQINLDPIEGYLDSLFSSPAFATVVAILSLFYAYFLYRKTKERKRLLIMSMSNGQREKVRKTEIVILNDGSRDLTKRDLLDQQPLRFVFKKRLEISDIQIVYESNENTKAQLVETKSNRFKLKFRILKKGDCVVIKLFHDSKLHMDDVWKEFDIKGTLIDVAIKRDDYSDQMVYRANSINMPLWSGTLISAFTLSYVVRVVVRPLPFDIPNLYIVIGCGVGSYLALLSFLLNQVGHREYKLFWKILEKSRNR